MTQRQPYVEKHSIVTRT